MGGRDYPTACRVRIFEDTKHVTHERFGGSNEAENKDACRTGAPGLIKLPMAKLPFTLNDLSNTYVSDASDVRIIVAM